MDLKCQKIRGKRNRQCIRILAVQSNFLFTVKCGRGGSDLRVEHKENVLEQLDGGFYNVFTTNSQTF